MKILFVENRYKTALWEEIGKDLQEKGNEIHWIVQNPQFTPSFGTIHLVPFPDKAAKENVGKSLPDHLVKTVASNRALNYFELQDDGFVFHYDAEIRTIVREIKPDLVIGESTAFHELLVIEACKSEGILYLNPSSSRYPSGRFSFYKHDTLEPFGRSMDQLSSEEALELIDRIVNRAVKPDYMKKLKPVLTKKDLLQDKIRLIRGYYAGEKYNTPSPFVKRKLNKRSIELTRKWDASATAVNELPQGFKVLFPLQMQPEANIDVWGYPHRNQKEVIRQIIEILEPQEYLVIKPNPKSKYEIDQELLSLIQSNSDKVFWLNHISKMDAILEQSDFVVTVTGTISIECILANIPVVMYGTGIQLKQKNCVKVNEKEDLRKALETVQNGLFPQIDDEQKIEFLKELVDTSYQGIIGDGLHGREHLENKENMERVKGAFHKIIDQVGISGGK